MPAHRLPRNSTAHRVAAIALYRALLLSTHTFAPDVFSPPQRTQLQNIIRNRFKQARHEQSPRYLRLCFEAGYEALDRLDAAGAIVAGEAEGEEEERGSAAYILALLARVPEKVKRAPPITALEPSLLKDLKLHLRTRHNPTAAAETEKPSLFDRPLPLAQLKGGKRKVPVLFNAQGVPVLRLSKPQPAALSGYLNHRAEVKQKRHDTRHRLTEELEGARWEDGWDGIIERETGIRQANKEESGRGREGQWTREILSARDEVGRKLSEDAERRRVMGERMQGVVDRERGMAETEGREEAERAFWEVSTGDA
ncbi:hypothetical protein LTR91_024760 [Friedmanniomyces endolithicus]|uniref:Complex 1 LYR protein domain-containing protein n=1 Tax=Friedmanniomyces endolithicus TaxID=329885 RepID=A0AAN6H3Q9_9PEZI|nr:hypothetical protein LTR35_016951 [Friedmanniomyces endolithicus]KAK0272227.1 hypothetical protein LTS00_016314 [Friedmanniomyces endolithicus]KAK0305497.1 hypothetical protein LTR82_016728 [Friedmanniomyces endolithicus]KAK0926180.1 hypothetical protein LTR57_004431 [Friedmanniomyces endolithicus]KAK0951827.1 hypothetical protein LTR91_024760 [Friedmanniomyces endolithicus]